jgi:hypothetical protein
VELTDQDNFKKQQFVGVAAAKIVRRRFWRFALVAPGQLPEMSLRCSLSPRSLPARASVAWQT